MEARVTCLFCNKRIDQPRRGRKRHFCCGRCREAYRSSHQKCLASLERCEYCGQILNSLQARRDQRYCSRKCWELSQRTLRGTVRTCVICGKQFEPRYSGQMCCNLACSVVKHTMTRMERCTEVVFCSLCGREFSDIRFQNAFNKGKDRVCKECIAERGREKDRQRGTAAQRGYDYEWQKARKQFLINHPLCVQCGAPANVAHHHTRRRDGGSNDESNLDALCQSCHSRLHSVERRELGIEAWASA